MIFKKCSSVSKYVCHIQKILILCPKCSRSVEKVRTFQKSFVSFQKTISHDKNMFVTFKMMFIDCKKMFPTIQKNYNARRVRPARDTWRQPDASLGTRSHAHDPGKCTLRGSPGQLLPRDIALAHQIDPTYKSTCIFFWRKINMYLVGQET